MTLHFTSISNRVMLLQLQTQQLTITKYIPRKLQTRYLELAKHIGSKHRRFILSINNVFLLPF